MTLATRCPACGTTFRVVQDQLKVSEGWVRCGRCSEVFSAIESLVDIAPKQEPAPAPLPAPIGVDDDFVDHLIVQAPVQDDGYRGEAETSDVAAGLPAEPVQPDPEGVPRREEVAVGAEAAPPPQGDAFESIESVIPGDVARPSAVTEASATTSAGGEDSATTPGFLREAERAARWRQPGVRAALALLALTLALTLGLQVALTYRDTVAARWPAARPFLVEACLVAGCRIEPLRDIGAVAVESSGLSQVDGTTVYRLSLVLRNRAGWAVMAPAVDLMLTDVQGRVLARKVLSVTELGSRTDSIAGRAEVALQANLSTGERRVTGYKIEIFHP